MSPSFTIEEGNEQSFVVCSSNVVNWQVVALHKLRFGNVGNLSAQVLPLR